MQGLAKPRHFQGSDLHSPTQNSWTGRKNLVLLRFPVRTSWLETLKKLTQRCQRWPCGDTPNLSSLQNRVQQQVLTLSPIPVPSSLIWCPMLVILGLGRMRQEDPEFWASLGYTLRPYLQANQPKINQIKTKLNKAIW